MSQQQNKRAKTSDDSQPGPSNISSSTADQRALARSEQVRSGMHMSATDVKKLEVELARYLLFADKKNVRLF